MTKHMQKPCPQCPFSKTAIPGALGGSHPLMYIGQSQGPFVLPCHKACDFDDPDWRIKTVYTPQCAGAAMYRANIEVDKNLPDLIHKLPKSDEVFGSHAEFLAHHMGLTVEFCEKFFENTPPSTMLETELAKQEVMYFCKDTIPGGL